MILTPTALDRTSNEGDWLRREIEMAIDEKRNLVPLFFDGFNFGSSTAKEKLTGKMANISRYNGLDIPSGYFPEAMERLRTRYLNVPLNAVIHPVPAHVRKKVKEEKVAANKALRWLFCLSESNIFPDATIPSKVTFLVMQFAPPVDPQSQMLL